MLYHGAGCPSPSGGNFTGSGNTDTQMPHGRKTTNPAPGDLIFYGAGGNPSHVEMVLDNGDCAGFGHQGGPFLHAGGVRNYRASERIGYYTYSFLDAA
jgi:cell wall-associated NlpC family hydrolase